MRLRSLLPLTLLAALAVPASAGAVEPGLVARYPFDATAGSGSATTTPDASGQGNTGRFPATPTLAPGRFASAFAGPAGAEPMTAADAPPLRPASAVSATAWVKQAGDPGFLKYLVAKGDFRYTPGGFTARAARTRSTRATAARPAWPSTRGTPAAATRRASPTPPGSSTGTGTR